MNLQGLVQPQCSLHHHPSQYTMHVQPQGTFHPPTATPMTPGSPPRPPIEALPKPMPAGTNQANQKHPLPQAAQQGPPNKQVRHKAFPHDQQPPATVSMATPSAVEKPRPSAPSPKGPPSSFMPTPGDVQRMSSSSPAVDPRDRSERGRYHRVRSASDIDGISPLRSSLNTIAKEVQANPSPSMISAALQANSKVG